MRSGAETKFADTKRKQNKVRKVIADDNAFGKAMSQNKALEARKMLAQGNALGKRPAEKRAL